MLPIGGQFSRPTVHTMGTPAAAKLRWLHLQILVLPASLQEESLAHQMLMLVKHLTALKNVTGSISPSFEPYFNGAR